MKVRTFLGITALFISIPAIAQPGDGQDPDTVPIGGIEILIALGSLLGIKKITGPSKELRDSDK